MSVKFGVVGCGHIGKRQCENILKIKGAELWGICDIESIDSDTLKGWGLETQHTDFEQFVNGAFDVLVVATPNHLHKYMTIFGIESGKRVLCEKPLTISKQDAHTIDEATKALGGVIYMDMPMRYLPAVQKVYEMIGNGTIGKIHSITMDILWNRNEEFYKGAEWRGRKEEVGSILHNEFIHFINLVRHWVGELWPHSMVHKNVAHPYVDINDLILIQFGAMGGTVGQFCFTTAAYEQTFGNTITILSEKANIQISGMMLEKLEINDEVIIFDKNMEHFTEVFRDIVRDINGEVNNIVSHKVGMDDVSFICDAQAISERYH